MSSPGPSAGPSSASGAAPAAPTASSMASCPICCGRLPSSLLSQHMSSHSKDEIVSELIRKTAAASAQQAQNSSVPSAAVQAMAAAPAAAAEASVPGVHFLSQLASAPTADASPRPPQPSLMSLPGGANGSSAPILVPPVMSMMQVMSPCLIPQPNGAPPLIVNMPSYVYPNMNMMNTATAGAGLIGALAANIAAAAATPASSAAPPTAVQQPQAQPQVILPTQPLPQQVASPSRLQQPVLHQQQVDEVIVVDSPPRATSRRRPPCIQRPPRPHSPPPTSPRQVAPLDMRQNREPKDLRLNSTTTASAANETAEDVVEVARESDHQRESATTSPVPGPSRLTHPASSTKVQSNKSKSKETRETLASTSTYPGSKPSRVQDTLLSETARDLNPLFGDLEPANQQSTEGRKKRESGTQQQEPSTSGGQKKGHNSGEGSNTFGFTQYAADSPYPAASLNFSSMLLEASTSATATAEDAPQPSTSKPPTPKASEDAASPKPPSPESARPASSSSPPIHDDDNSNSNVCTVQTVSDLQNALKSDDDIQIVVPNELLETSEFKSFISSLNSFPVDGHALSAGPSTSGGETSSGSGTAGTSGTSTSGPSSGKKSCAAPPNTPNTTRPPSVTADMIKPSPPPSPQPCSSRELSRGGFDEPPPPAVPSTLLPDESDDDDMTLQDLVAMETMDETEDVEDQFFTLSSNTNPLEPFMNSIIHESGGRPGGVLQRCDHCREHFGSIGEFKSHKETCPYARSKGVGKKSKSSALSKNRVKSSAAASASAAPPSDIIEDANMGEDIKLGLQADGAIKTESGEIKSEGLFDTASQPALGGTGDHWKCNQCKAVFETGPELLDHLQQIREAEHKCAACHVVFDDRKMLLLHRRRFHSATISKIKTEPASTATGGGGVAAITAKIESMLPNENGEFVCEMCDRAFREKDLLVKHMSCHDEEKPFECLACGKKFAKACLLRDHRRRHFEVGAFECSYCQKRFYTPNKLREHVRVHTGEAPLACNVCGKTFKRHSNLSEHKRIHLENKPEKPPKELFCHCGKVFKTQRDLDWHKEGEHEKQPKKCTYCGEVFVHSSSLTRHVRLRHEKNFVPENKKSSLYAACPICQQMFYKTSINKHIRIKHQNQKAYQCEVCKASFVTKCNLDNHMWQHKGIRSRPFKCQLCRKAYLRQSLLDAHMRSHRGVKPFVCNECGLQFANKSNWQRHVAEHSGARNFVCPTCDKRFSRGYYLTDHLKTHTGDKPYTCGICGKQAATRSNYNSHLRTHITREPVNSEV